MLEIKCSRKGCEIDVGGGASVTIKGPGTGHNTERYTLCHSCLGQFRLWWAGGNDVTLVPILDRQKIAERFVRKGLNSDASDTGEV